MAEQRTRLRTRHSHALTALMETRADLRGVQRVGRLRRRRGALVGLTESVTGRRPGRTGWGLGLEPVWAARLLVILTA